MKSICLGRKAQLQLEATQKIYTSKWPFGHATMAKLEKFVNDKEMAELEAKHEYAYNRRLNKWDSIMDLYRNPHAEQLYMEACLQAFLEYLEGLNIETDKSEIIEGVQEILNVTSYGLGEKVAIKFASRINRLTEILLQEENYQVIKAEVSSTINDEMNFEKTICDLKLCDLLQEMANIKQADIVCVKLELVPNFEDNQSNDILDLEYKMKHWGSNLSVKYANGEEENYQYIHLFNSIEDVELDGKTLLEHATFRKTPEYTTRVILNKDMDDIVCHLDLDYCFNKDKDFNVENGIGKAVLNCVNKGKMVQAQNIGQQLKLSLY